MDNFLWGVALLMALGVFAVFAQWFMNAIDPAFAANNERVRFIVLCQNMGGEKEGSYCVKNNEIVRINMRDLDTEND